MSRPAGTLTEENLATLATAPHRERSLSQASAKSIDKALGKLGSEAMNAAQTSVVLGEKNREGDVKRQASSIKAMENTGVAKTDAALKAERSDSGGGGKGGCCSVQ